MVKDVPVEGGDERAWKQGYQLAESCLEAIDGAITGELPVPVENLLAHFGISVESNRFCTISRCVRGAGRAQAQAGSARQRQCCLSLDSDARFTLAHDCATSCTTGITAPCSRWPQVHGRRLTLRSVANAFAAMLLMPTDLVGSVVHNLTSPPRFAGGHMGSRKRLSDELHGDARPLMESRTHR